MKKYLFLLTLLVLRMGVVGLLIGGCGQGNQASPVATTTTTSNPDFTSTSTTISSITTTTNALSQYFDVTGAKAIASAYLSTSNISAAKVKVSETSANDLLKLTANGTLTSVLNFGSYSPVISVIENGPDGSLYLAFQYKIPFYINNQYKSFAFFRIFLTGSIEVVDEDVSGISSSYYDSGFGELPLKPIQFDGVGDVYYLTEGKLKKKLVNGDISQIGSSNSVIQDFLVMSNGNVIFRGCNSNDNSIKWVRIVNRNNVVGNLFYNDPSISNSSYLRSYFLDKDSNVILVGENLTIQIMNEGVKSYDGILRVYVDDLGQSTSIEVLYDDKNMYSSDTIGQSLVQGFWEGSKYTRYLAGVNGGYLVVPLSLEAGVEEGAIKKYIRSKFKKIYSDTLDEIVFEGMTTTETSYEGLFTWLNLIIDSRISGETWSSWRDNNGLNGVSFGNAKQLFHADDGAVYAIIKLDNWGGSIVNGDRVYQILDSNGTADMIAYPQDNTFKYMKRSRIYGDDVIYISSTAGGDYKLFKLDLNNPSNPPIDLTPDKNNVEISSFSYNPVNNMLIYDVYDLNNNMSYLVEQNLTTSNVVSENAAAGYTIIDVVPFESVTVTTTTSTTTITQ